MNARTLRRAAAAVVTAGLALAWSGATAAEAQASSDTAARFVTVDLPVPPPSEAAAEVTAPLYGGPTGNTPGAPNGTNVHFQGLSEVGALFASPVFSNGNPTGAPHYCTASVVNSAKGDIVMTAAHCVYNGAHPSFLAFAPKYYNGPSEYGVWYVSSITVTAGWAARQDPTQDYAFLTVRPYRGHTVQQYTGGLALTSTTLPREVTVIGYNQVLYDPQGDEPVACNQVATLDPEQVNGTVAGFAGFYCPNYQDGTSGGPWIEAGTNRVVGVIGGYEQGGNFPYYSYSSLFTHNIFALYHAAAH